MGAFFNEDMLGGVVNSAVTNAAGTVIKAGETTLSSKLGVNLANLVPTPLPEMDDVSKAAAASPPVGGVMMGPASTTAEPSMIDRAVSFAQQNKMLVGVVAGVVVLGLITGAIKLRGA